MADKQLWLWIDEPNTEEPLLGPEPPRVPTESPSSSEDDSIPHLITSGVIAQELRQPLHRIRWVLRTRADIRPAAYAGTLRLFTQATVARVRYELNLIDAKRTSQIDEHL